MNDELAKIRAARAQRAADEQRKIEETSRARELEDERAIDAAEQKLGARAISVVRTERGVVIVRRPARVVFQRFVDARSTSTADLEKLVRPCLEHPSAAEFEALLDEYPGELLRVSNAVIDLASASAKDSQGKF